MSGVVVNIFGAPRKLRDSFEENKHPRSEGGQFGSGGGSASNTRSKKTSQGYKVETEKGPGNNTTHAISHPDSKKVHVVVHDPKGNVVSHQVREGNKSTPLSKAQSKEYSPIHRALTETKSR